MRRRRVTLLRAYWSVPTTSILSRFRGQSGDSDVNRKKFLAITTLKNRIRLLSRIKIRETINSLTKTINAVCNNRVTKQARKAARIPVYSQNNSATEDNL